MQTTECGLASFQGNFVAFASSRKPIGRAFEQAGPLADVVHVIPEDRGQSSQRPVASGSCKKVAFRAKVLDRKKRPGIIRDAGPVGPLSIYF
jgi:hypothetical protein